jgi:phenylacetate-CoA ligase
VEDAKTYIEAFRNSRISREELRELQYKKLRRVIALAYQNVPFYRRRFARASTLEGFGFRSLEDLRTLPILERSDVERNGEAMISQNLINTLGSYSSTTGTSGARIRLAFSREYHAVTTAMTVRHLLHYGARPWHRIVSIWPPTSYWRPGQDRDGRLKRDTFSLSFPLGVLGRPLPFLKPLLSSNWDVERDAEVLRSMNPDFVICRPSNLRRIGRFLKARGESIHPRGLVLTNEVFTQTCARELEGLYGSEIFWGYGAAEVGPMGAVCTAHRGLHFNEDFIFPEVLKDDEPVGPGETGELVVTSLHNPLMPFIRYRLGDVVEMADGEACPCGSNLMRIRKVLGRKADWLMNSRREQVSPLTVADWAESSLGLADYQLIQLDVGRFLLKTSPDEAPSPSALQRLKQYLESTMETDVVVETSYRTPDEFWSKSRPVLSRVTLSR